MCAYCGCQALDAIAELTAAQRSRAVAAALAHLDPTQWEALEAVRAVVGSGTRATA